MTKNPTKADALEISPLLDAKVQGLATLLTLEDAQSSAYIMQALQYFNDPTQVESFRVQKGIAR